MPIPRHIHQTWKTKVLSGKFAEWTNSWKRFNPTWTWQLWDDADCEKLISDHFPNILDLYRGLIPVQRADLFRYAVLWVHGGFYADIDAVCTTPLERYLEPDDQLVVGIEAEPQRPNLGYVFPVQYCQWAMGAQAQHPTMLRAVEVTVSNVRNADRLRPIWRQTASDTLPKGENGWETIMKTGPGAWTEAITSGLKNGESIRVLPECAFAVKYTNASQCPASQVYLRHHYLGSWKGGSDGSWLLITLVVLTLCFTLCMCGYMLHRLRNCPA